MGAHTIVRFALDHGDRAAALVVVTPAYTPEGDADSVERWDALAAGLRSGGVDGFVAAYGEPPVPEAWRETIVKVLHQRLSAHEHPEAVADALEQVPRSRAFDAWDELAELELPAVVVASRDDADPGHPYAIGERYAAAIPGAPAALGGAGRLAARVAGGPALQADRGGRRPGPRLAERLHARDELERALHDRLAVVGDRPLPERPRPPGST